MPASHGYKMPAGHCSSLYREIKCPWKHESVLVVLHVCETQDRSRITDLTARYHEFSALAALPIIQILEPSQSCSLDKSFVSYPLKFYVLRRDLACRLLSILISFHWRQTEWCNKELPSAQSERQILSNTVPCTSSTFTSLGDQR